MKTAFLMLVHKYPTQVERTLRKMYHPDFDFFIHLDKKADSKSYLNIKTLPNVFFVKNRVDVTWGGYSIIKATFNGVREICQTGNEYNFINFLSGQDYPIKPAEVIARFFEENTGNEFIKYRDILSDWNEAQVRYKKYFLTDFNFKGSTRLERIINFFASEKKMPYNFHPYGESMFWMLSTEVASYIVDRVQNDKKLESFFTYSWGTDEFLFQTILMNSPYRERVINNNYRYVDWSEQKAHPKILRTEDFDKLKKSSMMFARKFDIFKDRIVLDLLDTII